MLERLQIVGRDKMGQTYNLGNSHLLLAHGSLLL
jgi:hypothetical protein